jgi:hypothetical protein
LSIISKYVQKLKIHLFLAVFALIIEINGCVVGTNGSEFRGAANKAEILEG